MIAEDVALQQDVGRDHHHEGGGKDRCHLLDALQLGDLPGIGILTAGGAQDALIEAAGRMSAQQRRELLERRPRTPRPPPGDGPPPGPPPVPEGRSARQRIPSFENHHSLTMSPFTC